MQTGRSQSQRHLGQSFPSGNSLQRGAAMSGLRIDCANHRGHLAGHSSCGRDLSLLGTIGNLDPGTVLALAPAGDGSLQRIAPHLTLVPPVNVRAGALDEAVAVLRAAASDQGGTLELDLGPAGTFLPLNPVVFLDVNGPGLADLARLHRAVRPALCCVRSVGPGSRTSLSATKHRSSAPSLLPPP